MERISKKVQTWSSWNKPKALLFQSEIKQGIDDMRRELDDCATRFHVGPNDISLPHFCSPFPSLPFKIMSQMEILSNQKESRLSLEASHSEIHERMQLVLDSIQDIHTILKQPDPKIKDHMLHVQEAIHANVAEPEQRNRLQQHLLKVHRRTELLPPIIDRMTRPLFQ